MAVSPSNLPEKRRDLLERYGLARPTPGGGTRHVSVSGFPVFNEDGRFLGYRGVGRDITQRKRAEAQHSAHLCSCSPESMRQLLGSHQGSWMKSRRQQVSSSHDGKQTCWSTLRPL